MYTEFYGLKEKPFNLTPSPRFLYLSEGHKEALALLKYGVMDRKGFILLTGEVGTGKTTMVRTLLDSLNHTVKYVLLSNPLLSQKDFVNYIALSVFKKKIHFHSKAHFLIVFEPYLKKTLNNHQNFNLIIDEAHKLSFDLLEEIRLLSNMETGDDKLINIFLVGQPELNEKLSDPKCRSLLQRISIRHHIQPLNFEESREYMATRLKVAGAEKGNHIFSKGSLEAIYDFSRGYPREINIIADNALLLGYSRGTKKITPSMVKECYQDLKLSGVAQAKPELERVESDPQQVETELERVESEPELKFEQVETHRSSRVWKWVAVIIFFLAFSVMASSPIGKEIISRLNAIITSTYQAAIANIEATSLSGKNETEREISDITESDRTEIQKAPSRNVENHKIQKQAQVEEPSADTTAEKETEAFDGRQAPIRKIDNNTKAEIEITALEQPVEAETPMQDKKGRPSKIIIVGRGDTLSGLARKIYGKTSDEIIATIKGANPNLRNVNFIKSGGKIVFPQLPEFKKNATFTVHVASYKLYEPALNMYRDLLENGYEVYVLPKDDPQKGKIFRVTVGYFKTQKEAKAYAATIVKEGVSTYANAIEVKSEVRGQRSEVR
jgi:type II secretory pathway predicted ATPase ExeA/phage tail protein X